MVLPDHPAFAFSLPTGPDMMILAVLVLVLFGAKKLPVFARSLGRSMGEFRRAKEEFERQLRGEADEERMREDEREREREKARQEDPHAGVNRIISMIFFFCLLVLIVSIVRQVMGR